MPAQAHAEDDAPPEEAGPEPKPDPPGASDTLDTPDEEEPALGTYDDGRFEPL